MEHIDIGPVPGEESCAQVGSPDYIEAARRECETYRRMLHRLFPVPQGIAVSYVVRSHPHDFGNYLEVGVRYDEAIAAAVDFAYQVELSAPSRWDAIAQYELAWFERKHAYARAVIEKRMSAEEVPQHFLQAQPPSFAPGTALSEILAIHPL